jgi:hypothetical protein
MQYHVEIEPDTVDNWGSVPAYRRALEATLGPEALPGLKVDAEMAMAGLMDNAERLYRNFRQAISIGG